MTFSATRQASVPIQTAQPHSHAKYNSIESQINLDVSFEKSSDDALLPNDMHVSPSPLTSEVGGIENANVTTVYAFEADWAALGPDDRDFYATCS
jgi:hypothetical protein